MLESFSNPLMRRYESQYRFATLQTYPDGVTSDFHFAAEQGAQHAWRYPDLTTMCATSATCCATDGFMLISDLGSISIGQQFSTRSGLFAAQ